MQSFLENLVVILEEKGEAYISKVKMWKVKVGLKFIIGHNSCIWVKILIIE